MKMDQIARFGGLSRPSITPSKVRMLPISPNQPGHDEKEGYEEPGIAMEENSKVAGRGAHSLLGQFVPTRNNSLPERAIRNLTC
ncbi:MAG: hypothetical protein L0H94_01160 [Nitrospira sp.]|nr:hypothetical protein [Nitrospira sp.]